MRVFPLLLSAALALTTAVVTTSAAQAADGSCATGSRLESTVPRGKAVGQLVVAVDKATRTATACFYRVGEAKGDLADLYVEISGPKEHKIQGPAHYNTVVGHAGPLAVAYGNGACAVAGGSIKWRGVVYEAPEVRVC